MTQIKEKNTNLLLELKTNPVNLNYYSILEELKRANKILSNISLITIDIVEGKISKSDANSTNSDL